MGVAAFAPPLDDAGNSVKAQAALSDIVGRLNLNSSIRVKASWQNRHRRIVPE